MSNVKGPTREEAAMLEMITAAESSGKYNVINGGESFDDYSKHPVKGNDITGNKKGAGRYQFMPGTWEDVSRKYELEDFSPANQDAGALGYARDMWELTRGSDTRSMSQALKEDPNLVFRKLNKTWTSLPGGREENKETKSAMKNYNAFLTGEKAMKSYSVTESKWNFGYDTLPKEQKAKVEKQAIAYSKEAKAILQKANNGKIELDEYQDEMAKVIRKYPLVADYPDEANRIYQESTPEYAIQEKYNTSKNNYEDLLKKDQNHKKKLKEVNALENSPEKRKKLAELKKEGNEQSTKHAFYRFQDAIKNRHEYAALNGEEFSDEQKDAYKKEYELYSQYSNLDVTEAFNSPDKELIKSDISAKILDDVGFDERSKAILERKNPGVLKRNALRDLIYENKTVNGENVTSIVEPEKIKVKNIPANDLIKNLPDHLVQDLDTDKAKRNASNSISKSGAVYSDTPVDEKDNTKNADNATEEKGTDNSETLNTELDQPIVYKMKKQNFFEKAGGPAAAAGFAMTLAAIGEGDQDPGDIELPRVSEMVMNHANTLREISQRGLNPVEEAKILNDINRSFQSAVKVVKEISGGQRGAALAGISSANVARNEGEKNKALLDIQVKRQALVDYSTVLRDIDSRNQNAGAQEAQINFQMQKDRALMQGSAIANGVQTMINAQQLAEETGPGSLYDIQKQYQLSKFDQVITGFDEAEKETKNYFDFSEEPNKPVNPFEPITNKQVNNFKAEPLSPVNNSTQKLRNASDFKLPNVKPLPNRNWQTDLDEFDKIEMENNQFGL
jgi:muramidase (phage lysozyme)